MAVVGNAQERPDSPSGSIQTGDDVKATFTRKFLVETDSKNTGPIEVMNAVGIPRPYQLYTFGAEAHIARVVDRSAERIAPASLYWEVEVKYESPSNDDDEDETAENPLLEPPEISLTFENTQEPVLWAIDSSTGNAVDGIRNSAGELYNPAPVKDVARPVLKITRNEDIASPIVGASVGLVNAVNGGGFWGAGAGQCRCTGITVDRETKEIEQEAGTYLFAYLKVTYEFKFHEKGWQLELLDYGSYYLDNMNRKREFKTEDGHPHLDLLNCNGKPGGPCFLPEFIIYPSANFGLLNLPQNFTQ